MPTAPSIRFSNAGLLPLYSPITAMRQAVNLPPNVTYTHGQILAEQIGANAQQSVTIGGGATGGTFTLTWNSLTTAPIAWNATALAVQAALNALTGAGPIGFAVSGVAGGPWTVTFAGPLGSQPQATLTGSAASLTGGAPTLTIASVVTGVTGTPGLFWAIDPTQTDGRQIPKCILEYDATVDALGNITYGSSGVEWNWTLPSTPAFIAGVFATQDLIGLTDAVIASSNWTLKSGTISNGVIVLAG